MANINAGIDNRILGALPRTEYNRLAPHLARVPLREGQVLGGTGDGVSAVYFPNDSVISLLYGMRDHPALVVDAVGREGVVGIAQALGYHPSSHGAVVQHAGTAMKMMAGTLRKNTIPGKRLQHLLKCDIHARLAQVTQSIACDRLHPLEERLASWLLLTQDRVGSNQFRGTQARISGALRVRRERLNVAAVKLQRHNLVEHSRGYIRIANRKRLEAAACSCYALQKQRCDAYLCA
jgi:CRP-like cAMP-binding protein